MPKGIFKSISNGHIRNKLILSLIVFLIIISYVLAAQNPAAQLCVKKGNSFEKHIDKDGSEYGVCVLKDGTKEDVWTYFSNNAKSNSLGKDKTTINSMHVSGNEKNKYLAAQELRSASTASVVSSTNRFQDSSLLAAAPASFDWRSKNSQNYVTSIKDQGLCGACWAFTTEAAVESKTRINLNFSNYNIDLSEQDLISCGGVGDCIGGSNYWALDYIKTSGVVTELSFPYTATNNLCSNKKNNNGLTKAGYALVPNNANAIKEAISTIGPVIVYLGVCDDFKGYTGGIYSHSNSMINDMSCWTYVDGEGYYLIEHTMILVGYDDIGQYWIAKNSWGKGWGENGYMRIAYSQSVENSSLWFDELNSNQYSTESRILFLDDSYKITTTDSNADGKSDSDFLSPIKTRATNDSFYFNYTTNSKTNYSMVVTNGTSKLTKTSSSLYTIRNATLTGLKPNITYTYTLTVCDSSRNCQSKNGTIKTQANSQATTPTLKISSLKTRIKNDSMYINISISSPANYTLVLTSGTTRFIKSDKGFSSFWNITFSGLKPNTTYQYNLTVCDPSKKCITQIGSNKTLVNQKQNSLYVKNVTSAKTTITFTFTSSYASNYTLVLTSGTTKFVKSDSKFNSSRIVTVSSLKSNTTYNYQLTVCDSTKLCSQKTGQKKTLV